MRRWIVAGLVGFLAVAVAVAMPAIAQSRHISGPESARAARAAMAYVHGESAAIVRPGAPGYAWQFRVLCHDGTVTDVLLDDHLDLVDVGDSPSFATHFHPRDAKARSSTTSRHDVHRRRLHTH